MLTGLDSLRLKDAEKHQASRSSTSDTLSMARCNHRNHGFACIEPRRECNLGALEEGPPLVPVPGRAPSSLWAHRRHHTIVCPSLYHRFQHKHLLCSLPGAKLERGGRKVRLPSRALVTSRASEILCQGQASFRLAAYSCTEQNLLREERKTIPLAAVPGDIRVR